jgi:prepilin-type N-terminal cleavage/methylation domain-containing protein
MMASKAQGGGTVRGTARGFTLLEVLVALALLSIAGITIFQLFSANLRAINLSGDYVAAEVKALAKLQEVMDRDDIAEGIGSEVTGDGYRMDMTVAEALRERTGGLSVRLLDVALTVHWKKNGREKSLTLRTMKLLDNEGLKKVPRL